MATALPPHVATISGDAMAKGGSGEVISGAKMLGGQAMACEWPRSGQFFAIKGAESLKNLGFKFVEFVDESRETNRGIFLLGVWASILGVCYSL